MCRTFIGGGGCSLGQYLRKGGEGSSIGQREGLSCDVVFVEASADIRGSSEAGTSPQSCPQLEHWGHGFIPPWTSRWKQATIRKAVTLDKAAPCRRGNPQGLSASLTPNIWEKESGLHP